MVLDWVKHSIQYFSSSSNIKDITMLKSVNDWLVNFQRTYIYKLFKSSLILFISYSYYQPMGWYLLKILPC